MNRDRYFLPDGTTTTSERRYVQEWHRLARPIEKLAGMRLCAFDPNIVLIGAGRNHERLELPAWFALLVDQQITKAEGSE